MAELTTQQQGEPQEPALDEIPGDAITDEGEGLNPPEQFQEERDAKQKPRRARGQGGDE